MALQNDAVVEHLRQLLPAEQVHTDAEELQRASVDNFRKLQNIFGVYTMPMPGMMDSKVTARHTKDGLYEGNVLFGMGGTWVVTVNVTVPGQPQIAEKFQFSVGGGM